MNCTENLHLMHIFYAECCIRENGITRLTRQNGQNSSTLVHLSRDGKIQRKPVLSGFNRMWADSCTYVNPVEMIYS